MMDPTIASIKIMVGLALSLRITTFDASPYLNFTSMKVSPYVSNW